MTYAIPGQIRTKIITSTSVGGGFSYSSSQLAGVLTSSPYLVVLNKSSVSIADSRLSNSTVEAIDHPNIIQSCPQLYLDANARINDSPFEHSTIVRGAALDILASMKAVPLNLSHPDLLTGAFVGQVLAGELGVG